MPTNEMKLWIQNFTKKNGRKPTPVQIQQAQKDIYKRVNRNKSLKIKENY